MPSPSTSAYLTGNYAPVPDETSITDLPVDGAIPAALRGRYLRNGPNPIGNPARPYVWADADGMVHEVTLRDERTASYRNRWVATGRASRLLGTEPVPGADPGGGDTANTSVVALGRRALTFSDRFGYDLGPGLATGRRIDLGLDDHRLVGRPRIDPFTGSLQLVASSPTSRTVRLLTVAPTGEVTDSHEAGSAGAHRVIDFLTTDRSILLFDERSIGLLRRGADAVQWMSRTRKGAVEPIAASEDAESLSVIVTEPFLSRWIIDLSRRTFRREPLHTSAEAFAAVNHGCVAQRCPRFVYALDRPGRMPYDGTGIIKHDLMSGTIHRRDFGSDRHPGEFVFVDDPDRDDREDGGWLVGLVHDDRTALTDLVVLDAQDFDAPAIATVHTTRRVPFGLHGSWTTCRERDRAPSSAVAARAPIDRPTHPTTQKERS